MRPGYFDVTETAVHELEPWEKRCHALADVLGFHEIINAEEKRRGVEARWLAEPAAPGR